MPLQRRIPKRGFTNIFKQYDHVLNVREMECFSSGSEVGPEDFVQAGLVRNLKQQVKLLADGDISIPLTIRVHKASAAAVQKVEAAGGRVELIPFQKRI